MEKPSNLLLKLTRRLFENPNEQDEFIQALVNPQPFQSLYSLVSRKAGNITIYCRNANSLATRIYRPFSKRRKTR